MAVILLCALPTFNFLARNIESVAFMQSKALKQTSETQKDIWTNGLAAHCNGMQLKEALTDAEGTDIVQ